MRPLDNKERVTLAMLAELVARDAEEAAAYDAAMRSIRDAHDLEVLRRFRNDHVRHAAFIRLLVHTLGGEAAAHAQRALGAHRWKAAIARGRLAIARPFGERATLEAVLRTEKGAGAAYLAAIAAGLPERAFRVIEQNLRDELRHGAWLELRFASCGIRAA
jgi:hypothetical protein